MTHRVFSYGTLRQENVQRALFGGPVPTTPDALLGWRLEWVTITDPEVLAASGLDRHPILVPGAPTDAVDGAVLDVDDAGLRAIDDYEVADYRRIEAPLRSGSTAWVFVSAQGA